MELAKLKKLSLACVDRGFITHALGWTKHLYNKSWENPKKALHSIRPLMTALHFQENRAYLTNIQELVTLEPMTKYQETTLRLIELKKADGKTDDVTRHDAVVCYDELCQMVKDKEQLLPARNEMDGHIRPLLSYMRLRTLEEYGNQRMEMPELSSQKEEFP